MAKQNFKDSLTAVLRHEGEYTNDRRDPGNWTGGKVGSGTLKGTKKGISAAAYPNLDIKNLTDSEIYRIYAQRYWAPVRGDDLPSGVDFTVFDYGVNSGVGRASKEIQRVVSAPVDGKIGPITLKAIMRTAPRDVIKKLCARRLSFMRSLRIWETYKNGWSRRVAETEALSLSWVSSKAELRADAKEATVKAVSSSGGAVVSSGGALALPDMTGLPVWLLLGAAVLIVFPLVRHAFVQAERATALSATAKEV